MCVLGVEKGLRVATGIPGVVVRFTRPQGATVEAVTSKGFPMAQ
jgi:hypothetical protein